jgi:hypothetical protein
VSWWRGEGNANDSVGANDGAYAGGVTFVPGRVGEAFEFDGTTGSINISNSTTLDLAQAYSFAFWIKLPALPSQQVTVMRKIASGTEDKHVAVNTNGTVAFYLYNVMSSVPLSSTTALSLATWHHVAATYDGASANIYIDGILDASKVATGAVANDTGAVWFAHSFFDITFLQGDLDELRWYSRALSAMEVAALAAGCE